MKLKLYISILILTCACIKRYEAPLPNLGWAAFDANTHWANGASMKRLEGIYSVVEGMDTFGDAAVLKWSYVIEGHDTTHYLSAFFNKEVSYFIAEGKRSGDSLILKGYWRKNITTETGEVRFKHLDSDSGLTGVFGKKDEVPGSALTLQFVRPLAVNDSFQVLAHRGGGRNTDLLPASENSIAMIKIASQFGATGIEIDVRLTSDYIPVLFHDNNLSERTIEKSGMIGRIENYSYDQLSTLVRLTNGEKIPTLREALDAVVYQTPIRFVWLDTKFEGGSLAEVNSIREEYTQKAAAAGRNLEILIGIPSEEAQKMLEVLPNYTQISSACELETDVVRKLNSKAWAPRWTLGTQNGDVDVMHAEGRKVYTWTIDVPEYVKKFIDEGKFDGILTNYPSIVAHYHYVSQK